MIKEDRVGTRAVTLKEFLETGALGPLACGMKSKEVQALLGAPAEFPGKKPRVWQFQSLQVAFDHKGCLYFLGVYFRQTPWRLPDPLIARGWWPSSHCTLDELLAQCPEIPMATGSRPELPVRLGVVSALFEESALNSLQFITDLSP